MEAKFITYFIIFVLILSLNYKILFAQDVFISRDNLIFNTLNYMEGMQNTHREVALREAMQEAQLKLAEAKFVRKKEKGPSLGNLASRMHPYLIQKTTLDDNVDSAAQKKASLINKFTAGSKMNFIGRNNSLAVDMHLDNTFYNNRSRYNSQSAAVDILNNFRIGRYILSLSDSFYDRHLAVKESGADDDDLGNYWRNTFKSTLGRAFNRVGFDMGYKRSDYDYEPAFSYRDRTEETFSYNPYLRITKKTKILAEYSYGRTKYNHLTDPDDSHSHDSNLSLSSVLSPKITAVAKIGYKCTDQKTSSDSRETTLRQDISYAPSVRSNLAFMLKHVIHEDATDSGYYTENDFKLSGNHRLAFNPKLRLYASAEADRADYPKKEDMPNAEKNTYIFELGLRYAFKQWLDLSLDWKHTKVNSDVDTSYERNEAVFQAQLTF